jgi:Legume lectin domain
VEDIMHMNIWQATIWNGFAAIRICMMKRAESTGMAVTLLFGSISEGQMKTFPLLSSGLIQHIRAFGALIAWVGLTFASAPAQAAFISMQNFNSLSAFKLAGSAAAIDTGGQGVAGPNTGDDRVLRLTNDLWQAGSAFYATPFSLARNASFSSYFEFQFAPTSQWGGADGMVFVIQNGSNTVGTWGGGIGYGGMGHSIGVEFDDWNNGEGDGNNSNHAGIDINGNVNSVVRADVLPAQLDSGAIFHAWVDYNGVADLLEVRVGLTNIRPTDALMSYNLDLVGLLGSTNAYMGFTSGTGSVGSYHDVRNWVVEKQFDSITSADNASQAIPEPNVLSLFFIAMLGLWTIRAKAGKNRWKLFALS